MIQAAPVCAIVAGLLLLAGIIPAGAAPEGNLLRNPSVEELEAGQERPAAWVANHFNTGGTWAVGTDGGHDGGRYLILRSATETQRACWRQKVALPEGAKAVAFGGHYRTRGVTGPGQRGASLRVLFHRDVAKWDEIGLKQAFFPPATEWTEAQGLFFVPEGTRAVVLEAFHWLTPGETHWDSLWLRVATEEDLKNVPFEPGTEIDREPVPGRNKPYSPADGETVRLNPPPFLWLPSGREVTYRLQIARNDRFEGRDVISLEGLEWCAEMLTRPLEPGIWYWRYGVDRPGLPTAWSRARRFEVARDASPWVYPGRDAFTVPTARPRLFVHAGRLAELRERARSGDLKSIADALVRSIQRHIGEPLVPEPKHLTGTGQTRSAQYLEVFVTTRPPMDAMERAALAYLLTGDRACGDEAKRRILHFFSWNPKGSTSVSHNDEPAMWIMMRGVRAYDWTYDLFTPEEQEKIEAVMRVRAADFYEHLRRRPFENNPYESHSGRIIGFLGEAALAFLPEWPEARKWLDYVTKIYWGVYPAWGKDDGGWNEGPGYWSAYMTFALHFVVALREATGIDLSQRPFFRSTPYYLLYLTPPYSNMSPFGDGTQFRPSQPAGLMYQFSSLLRDPAIRWYSDALGRGASSDILGIVLKDDSLKGMPPVHLPQARHFEGVGLVCLHTQLINGEENVLFAMRSSPYGAVSHGHNDQNTFVLEAFGEPLAIASGYYPRYGSPHHDQWTRQTKAKCGITFDGGQGQDRGWHAKGAITAFVHGEGFDFVSGDATPAYGGRLTRAVREVIHVRPGIIVIRDDLASAEPRRYEYWLHALDEMKVDAAARTVTTTRPKATLRTRFLHPEGLVFTQDNKYEPAPEGRPDRTSYSSTWYVTATTREPAQATEFLSVLLPAKAGQEANLPTTRHLESKTVRGVELRFPDGSRTVAGFALPGVTGTVSLEEISTDGRTFAVAYDANGQPRSWLLSGGRTLRDGQRVLAQAAEPVTLTAAVTEDGGRIDAAGPGGEATLWWPKPPRALTRDAETVRFSQARQGAIRLSLNPREDRVEVWAREPVPPGEAKLLLETNGQVVELTGRRFGRGRAAVSGRVNVDPGAYRFDVPKGVDVTAGVADAQGRFWLRGDEMVMLSGAALPDRVKLVAALKAARLSAQPQSRLPQGITYEAEQNWRVTGGEVEVSRGGHANVSGEANLWSWNTPGSTISWEIEVKEAGTYEIWFVGATEGGLLAEFAVDGGEALGLRFEPTGGWGRTAAGEWRAFQVRAASGTPARFKLDAGRHRLALTNRTGVGLNLDRILLMPVR